MMAKFPSEEDSILQLLSESIHVPFCTSTSIQGGFLHQGSATSEDSHGRQVSEQLANCTKLQVVAKSVKIYSMEIESISPENVAAHMKWTRRYSR